MPEPIHLQILKYLDQHGRAGVMVSISPVLAANYPARPDMSIASLQQNAAAIKTLLIDMAGQVQRSTKPAVIRVSEAPDPGSIPGEATKLVSLLIDFSFFSSLFIFNKPGSNKSCKVPKARHPLSSMLPQLFFLPW